jgi:hypothetical protein
MSFRTLQKLPDGGRVSVLEGTPKKTYRVWIEVEEYDEAKDEYRNCDGLGGAEVVTLPTEQEAFSFAERLQQMGQIMASLYGTRKETNATKRQNRAKKTA